MATVALRCPCGQQVYLDGRHAEARVQCAHCGRVLHVRAKRRAGARLLGRLARPVTIAAWAYAACVSAAAALMWGLGDRWWPATVLLFAGRWVALLPLIGLVPLAALAARRALIALALGAVVVWGPLMGGRIALPRSASDARSLRVVTFNADVGDAIASDLPALLALWRPDVVALQECGERLATAVQHTAGWYHDAREGLCLLSRFPIRAIAVMDRSALAAVHADDAGIGGAGYVITYRLETPRGAVSFTNLHLETPRKGLEELLHWSTANLDRIEANTRLRDIESMLARRHVGAGGSPLIVAGDFNTPVESRTFREHWGDLTDAFDAAGIGFGMTKYNGWIRARIDHVLTDRSWRVDAARVAGDAGSDHRPLVVDLTRRD